MSHMVGSVLTRALDVPRSLDADEVEAVMAADEKINEKHFALEKKCTALIATQQPAARDLRAIIAVLSMIVDLERMGDQAKGIAKIIPHLVKYPAHPKLPELTQMGNIAKKMLHDSMTAYADADVALATSVAIQDNKVDQLYADTFRQDYGLSG